MPSVIEGEKNINKVNNNVESLLSLVLFTCLKDRLVIFYCDIFYITSCDQVQFIDGNGLTYLI